MASKVDVVEQVVNIPTERLWKAMLDSHKWIAEVCPEFFKSIENHGDGTRIVTFGPVAVEAAGNTFIKEKRTVDDSSKTVTLETIEGGSLGKKFETLKTVSKFAPGNDGTTVATLEVVYSPIGETGTEDIKMGSIAILKAIEAHLLANPTIYS